MNKHKIISIIGARPQFIKAAAISRSIRNTFHDNFHDIIIHTGQHYDDNMSKVFFEELEIPQPDYNLGIGPGSHAFQLSGMLKGIEPILLKEKPGAVVVYGDTNTTLAGALAAKMLHLPVIHIEAGLRSYNKSMPEEVNRVLCDHVSTLLFSPTMTGIRNLGKEGFRMNNARPYTPDNPGIFHCGDVMYDNVLYYSGRSGYDGKILERFGIKEDGFILCTIHRPGNTDDSMRLNAILASLDEISREHSLHFVLPLHPRTQKMISTHLDEEISARIKANPYLIFTEPASYFDMLVLEKNCRMIITDSGGVQKEAHFFGKPSLVLRPETEWKELPEAGSSRLTDSDPALIREAFAHFLNHPPDHYASIFGDGHASEFILTELLDFLN